jgi:hypothetical protein
MGAKIEREQHDEGRHVLQPIEHAAVGREQGPLPAFVSFAGTRAGNERTQEPRTVKTVLEETGMG